MKYVYLGSELYEDICKNSDQPVGVLNIKSKKKYVLKDTAGYEEHHLQ